MEAPESKLSRIDHAKLWIAAMLARCVAAALGLTYRIEVTAGAELLRELPATRKPTVIGFWHDSLFILAFFVQRRLVRQGYPVTSFSSRSKDGELGAKLGKMWGAGVVRGSGSRGGTTGLRGLYRAVVRDGSSPVITLDGPKGPRREAKPGAIALARLCRVPVLPMTYSTDRCWRLRSWDRMTIPKPFARVRVAVGRPFKVPDDASDAGVERTRVELESALADLQELAGGEA